MHYETTAALLEVMKPYIGNAAVEISTDNKDWLGRDDRSDFVSIDPENSVGVQIYENAIIVFYFTDHYHFDDDACDLAQGAADYIERAKAFLKDLFTCEIRHVECYRGRHLASEQYFMQYHDGREEEQIGNIWYGLARPISLFGKKSTHSTMWQFDPGKGVFTTRQP